MPARRRHSRWKIVNFEKRLILFLEKSPSRPNIDFRGRCIHQPLHDGLRSRRPEDWPALSTRRWVQPDAYIKLAGRERSPLRAANEQRAQRDGDVGPIPEGSWKLAGGKTVKPSRPPVAKRTDVPPRMGRGMNGCRRFQRPCRGTKHLVAKYRGPRSARRPANIRQPSGFLNCPVHLIVHKAINDFSGCLTSSFFLPSNRLLTEWSGLRRAIFTTLRPALWEREYAHAGLRLARA